MDFNKAALALHEEHRGKIEVVSKIRVASMEAGKTVKVEGKPNNLLDLIVDDEEFGLDRDSLDSLLDPKLYIGRCPEQVTTFIEEAVKPVLAKHAEDLKVEEVELKV